MFNGVLTTANREHPDVISDDRLIRDVKEVKDTLNQSIVDHVARHCFFVAPQHLCRISLSFVSYFSVLSSFGTEFYDNSI